MTTPQAEAGSAITLSASHSFLQIFLLAVAPRIVIDGVETTAAWGEQTFPVSPGEHAVEVFFPYFGGRAGKAGTAVSLRPGEGVRLVYRTPMVVTSSGKLRVEPGARVG